MAIRGISMLAIYRLFVGSWIVYDRTATAETAECPGCLEHSYFGVDFLVVTVEADAE